MGSRQNAETITVQDLHVEELDGISDISTQTCAWAHWRSKEESQAHHTQKYETGTQSREWG